MGNSRKILIADDEPVVRQLLAQALGSQGFEVMMATNAKEAFELVKSHPIALVLTDINMPGGDGLQLMEWVRQSAKKDIPVILMTGDLDEFEKSRAAGVMILQKPFRRQELVELINSVLDPSRPPG